MRFLDMFSGIGGFHKGITEAHPDWECVGHSDIDKYANIIYKKHFPDVMSYGDATKINPEELPEFDMLCGGFPCQSFSIAGKRGGLEDTRGTLFFEIARIAKHRKPKYLFLENVKGLLSHDNGRTLGTILNTMGELGYWWEYQVLNSKYFGVPQNRERVFIIGHLAGERSRPVFPLGESGKGVNGAQGEAQGERQRVWGNDTSDTQVANTLAQRDYKGGNNLIQQVNSPNHSAACIIDNPLKGKTEYGWHFEQNVYGKEGICRSLKSSGGSGNKPKIITEPKIAIPVLTPNRPTKRQDGRRFKENGEPSFTLTGQDIHGVMEGARIRRLTEVECERLQGFPDNWTEGISATQRYKCLGNAVSVPVIKAIAERM